ncbi:response regulator [Bdellovibrionota bacterium FG-2]
MSNSRKRILVVDADSLFLTEIKGELEHYHEVEVCTDGKSAHALIERFRPQVVIVTEALVGAPFTEVLERASSDAIKIVTTAGLPTDEHIFAAIESKQADTCFVKPLNYHELKSVIEKLSVLRSGQDAGSSIDKADVKAVYEKVHTIFDRVSDAEKLQRQAQVQLEKARQLEEQSLARVQGVVRDIAHFKTRIGDLEKETVSLKDKSGQLEAQKNLLNKEKTKAQDALKEIEIQIDSTKGATIQVGSDLTAKSTRKKIDGKDCVLFVDDEEDMRRMFSDVFKSKYTIIVAEQADAALAMLKQHPEVALVVTDCRMPKKTGIELSYEIRKLQPDLPIFLLTGFGEMDAAIKAMNEGAIQQYYAKPFNIAELGKAIRENIDKSDEAVSQKSLVKEKKAFVVDRIKDLVAQVESLQYNSKKFQDEQASVQANVERLTQELAQARDEKAELLDSVAKERDTMRAEMTEEKVRVDAEIAKKLEDASKVIEAERLKYKDELLAMEQKFKEDKEKVEAHLVQLRKQMEAEKAEVERQLAEEKKRGEAEIEKIKADIAGAKARIEEEIRKELEVKKAAALAEIEELKKTVTRDLDRAKEEAAKKEKELTAQIAQATRANREKDDEIKTVKRTFAEIEKETAKTKHERDLVVKEYESMKGEYELIVQSRAALEAELSEVKGSR